MSDDKQATPAFSGLVALALAPDLPPEPRPIRRKGAKFYSERSKKGWRSRKKMKAARLAIL